MKTICMFLIFLMTAITVAAQEVIKEASPLQEEASKSPMNTIVVGIVTVGFSALIVWLVYYKMKKKKEI